MTPERLAEIEARAEAATDGPWDRANQASTTDVIVYGRDNERVARVTRFMSDIGLRNADFIAHARQDIPDLIAEVKRLREEVIECLTALARIEPEEDNQG